MYIIQLYHQTAMNANNRGKLMHVCILNADTEMV